MTIFENSRTVIGGLSGDWAVRTTRGGAVWQLSWLPDGSFTGEQARAGVELAEIAAEPRTLADPTVWAQVSRHVVLLNITVPQALSILLHRTHLRRSS